MSSRPPVSIEARELSPTEIQELREEAFRLETEIKRRVLAAHETYWALAEALWEFHELQGWTVLGYETLGQFLAQPDLGLANRSYHRAVAMWQGWAVDRKLPQKELAQLEPSKAREVLPAIVQGNVSPEDAIDDVKALSYRDVVEKYQAINNSQAPADGKLDATTEPVFVACPTCGTFVSESLVKSGTQEPDGD